MELLAQDSGIGIEALIGLMGQIPLVLLFVWWSLKIRQSIREETESLNALWHNFLIGERQQRKESMELGLREVKLMAESVTKLSESVATLAINVHTGNTDIANKFTVIREEVKSICKAK